MYHVPILLHESGTHYRRTRGRVGACRNCYRPGFRFGRSRPQRPSGNKNQRTVDRPRHLHVHLLGRDRYTDRHQPLDRAGRHTERRGRRPIASPHKRQPRYAGHHAYRRQGERTNRREYVNCPPISPFSLTPFLAFLEIYRLESSRPRSSCVLTFVAFTPLPRASATDLPNQWNRVDIALKWARNCALNLNGGRSGDQEIQGGSNF